MTDQRMALLTRIEQATGSTELDLAYQNERFERGPTTPVHCRDSVLFYVMTRVGPRRFEAAGARWDSVEECDGVTGWALHGKGDEDARTTLPPDVIEILASWKRQLARIVGRPVQPDDAIFPVLGRGRDATVPRSKAD